MRRPIIATILVLAFFAPWAVRSFRSKGSNIIPLANNRRSRGEEKHKPISRSNYPDPSLNQFHRYIGEQEHVGTGKNQQEQDRELKAHFKRQQAFELFRGLACFFSGPLAVFTICFFAWAGKKISNADLPAGSLLALLTNKTGFVLATLIVLGCVRWLRHEPEVEFHAGCLYFFWVIVCLVGGFAYFFKIANSLL